MQNNRRLLQKLLAGNIGAIHRIRTASTKDLKGIQSVFFCHGGCDPEHITITTTAKDGTQTTHPKQTINDWHRMEQRVDRTLTDSFVSMARITIRRQRIKDNE